MKKFLIILVSLVAAAGIVGTVYFWNETKKAAVERQTFISQNGELQAKLDAIGPMATVYTVAMESKAGKEVNAEDIVAQSIPQSSVSQNHIVNPGDVVGKYFKIKVLPGVALTTDLFMEKELDGTIYQRDISFHYLPIGLTIGDYIDVRMVLPYGEEYIVLEHVRVERRIDNVLTIHLNEEMLALYTSLSTDMALYKGKGMRAYVTKYIEPGISEASVPLYPVRKDMEAICVLNTNIKDKKRVINAEIRDDIETRLLNVSETDGPTVASGGVKDGEDINSAASAWITKFGGDDKAASDAAGGSAGGDTSSKPPEYTEDGKPVIPDMDQKDPAGNSDNITDNDRDEAGGSNLFEDEEVIN